MNFTTLYPPRQSASPWQFHEDTPPMPPRWLIKKILPEIGAALLSGQWGTYKTIIALDLSLSAMTTAPFAGQFKVKRTGGVLYFSPEAARSIRPRLTAIARQRGIAGPLPFAVCGYCPPLTSKDAAREMCAL